MKVKKKNSLVPAVISLLSLLCGAPLPQMHAVPFVHTTENYTIKTDISEELAEQAAQRMEAAFNEYRHRFDDLERKNHDRYTVFIFRQRRTYYLALSERAAGTTGAFQPGKKLIATYFGRRTLREVFRTLYHEGFHHFAYVHIGPDIPHWLNEGLAEYFSESVNDGTEFFTGQIPGPRLATVQTIIATGEYFPFNNFFEKGPKQWLAGRRRTEDTRTNPHYCQAWSIVHFLMHAEEGRFRDRIASCLQLMSENHPAATGLRACFGANTEDMEDAWINYVMSLTPDDEEDCQ